MGTLENVSLEDITALEPDGWFGVVPSGLATEVINAGLADDSMFN